MNDEEEKKYCQFIKVDETLTELYIYGEIRKPSLIEEWLGIEDKTRVDAFSLKDAIAQVDTPNLKVRINSDGGSVNEGLAIYSLLKDFKGHLITKVDGWACSAASVIFMAGQERIMPESGLIMIHNASVSTSGDANALRKMASDLDVITQPSVNIYASCTGLPEEEIKLMMNEETWMDCRAAFEKGFATDIQKDTEAQQSVGCMKQSILKLLNKISDLEEKLNQKETIPQNSWNHFFNK